MSEKANIMYIVPQPTEKCFSKIENLAYSPAGFNKATGIASLIKDSGYDVVVLSPLITTKKNGKIYKSFHEKYRGYDIYHSPVWNIAYIDRFVCILWISYMLLKKKNIYSKILFYNYDPITSIPAIFGKFFLRKKIYLEYEDGYFAIEMFKLLKWIISIDEKIGNYLISGAILVTQSLKPRVRTKNVQIIPGIIDHELYKHFTGLLNKRSKKIFMYSGGLDEIRGIDLFLETAEKILKEVDGNYEFWITGTGPLKSMVNRYTQNYPDKIYYYGFVSREHLLKLYEEVYVFLSLQKPQHRFSAASSPSKVYEFISTGKFCIGLMDLKPNPTNYIFVKDLNDLKTTLIDFIKTNFDETKPIDLDNSRIHIFDNN